MMEATIYIEFRTSLRANPNTYVPKKDAWPKDQKDSS